MLKINLYSFPCYSEKKNTYCTMGIKRADLKEPSAVFKSNSSINSSFMYCF